MCNASIKINGSEWNIVKYVVIDLSILQVFGVGIPNPYRLRPYLGAKVPLNSSFTPIIKIHNPFSSTLQVRPFMYTSLQLRQKLIDIIANTALE